jgi:hypothetical protein
MIDWSGSPAPSGRALVKGGRKRAALGQEAEHHARGGGAAGASLGHADGRCHDVAGGAEAPRSNGRSRPTR